MSNHARGQGVILETPETEGSIDKVCGRARATGEHFGAPRNLPSEAMAIANALPAPKNQGGTSTCVGHGIDFGAEARMLVQGIRIRSGSPLAICTIARTLAKLHLDEKLFDDGAFMRLGMQGAAEFGVPPESEWPLWTPKGQIVAELNEELPPDVYQRASAWKLKDQFRVYGSGQGKLDSVCAAIVQKYPLPCAGPIDEAFDRYDGKGVLGAPDMDKLVGGHCTCILAYRTVNGRRQFLVYSSWVGWGMAGQLAWVDEAWVLAMPEIYAFTMETGPSAVEVGRSEEIVSEETAMLNTVMSFQAESSQSEEVVESAVHTPRSGEIETVFDAKDGDQ